MWNDRNNLVVYDPVMVSLSRIVDHADELLLRKREIKEATKNLFEHTEQLWNGRNTSKSDVEKRIVVFEKMLRLYI